MQPKGFHSKDAWTPLVVVGALLSACLGSQITQFEPITDYFQFIAEYADRKHGWRLVGQFMLGALLYALFAALWFRIVFAEAALPSADRSKVLLAVDLFARLVLVLAPTIVLMRLFSGASPPSGGNWVIWLGLAIFLLSLLLQISAGLTWHPFAGLEERGCLGRALMTPVPLLEWASSFLTWIALATVLLLCSWLWLNVVDATTFIGGIGILFLFSIVVLLGLWLAAGVMRIRTLMGWLLLAVVISHVIGAHPLELRHRSVPLPATAADKAGQGAEQLAKARGVPALVEGFEGWLSNRPSFSRHDFSQRKYPVFIVAAQGGGQYAAYHTALFLARLYDRCPRLKDHVFAVSSVSGGSVGASVLAELLKSQSENRDVCVASIAQAGPLENAVKRFFAHDFVTPVIAQGLFFDLPSLLIPQLRLANDRATALELAVERAWQNASPSSADSGLGRDFYGKWSASGVAPALFLNMTSSNYGVPILMSELYMAPAPGPASIAAQLFLSAMQTADRFSGTGKDPKLEAEGEFREAVRDAIRSSNYTRPSYFNIFDYRPDIQVSLSTAAILSARFPYVTPPGVVRHTEKRQANDATLRETAALQLIDGGFWDNSGMSTAIQIVRQLQAKDLGKNVDFLLISFGHNRRAIQKEGARTAQSELVAAFATFEAVRQARRSKAEDAIEQGFKSVASIELFDHEFRAPLSWTLSERIRAQIEARSGGEVAPTLCCALPVPRALEFVLGDFVLDLGDKYHARDLVKNELRMTAPNKMQFDRIIRTVIQASGKTADAK